MPLPPPPPAGPLRGKHVKVETKDGDFWGILRSIANGWVNMELLVYHVDNARGVRQYQTFMEPEGLITCMLAEKRVTSIQKINNVSMM